MDHVLIRKLEHLTGSQKAPALGYALETRSTAGPAFKTGAFPHDVVWIKLHGGLVVGRAEVKLAWVGEFSDIREIRRRTGGAAIQRMGSFWQGRPRVGYAVVAELMNERWIEPVWQGPRTYAYEWVVLDDKKRAGWLQEKAPPRDGSELLKKFLQWRKNAG